MNIGEVLGNIGFDFKVFLFNTINFMILILLLKKFLFDKVIAVMDERKALINEGIENARKAEEELERANEKKKVIVSDAKKLKEDILDEAKAQANSYIEEAKSKASKQVEHILLKAEQDSKNLKEKVMGNVQKDIAKIVTNELKDKIVK